MHRAAIEIHLPLEFFRERTSLMPFLKLELVNVVDFVSFLRMFGLTGTLPGNFVGQIPGIFHFICALRADYVPKAFSHLITSSPRHIRLFEFPSFAKKFPNISLQEY